MLPDAELLRLLAEELDRHPDLRKIVDFHTALVGARAEVVAAVEAGWPERACLRLRRGESALSLADLHADWKAVTRLARRVCQIAACHQPALAQEFVRIGSSFGEDVDEEDLREIVTGHLEPKRPARPADVHSDLFAFVLHQALHPVLSAYAAAVESLPETLGWEGGQCPICGGPPDFAALDGEVGRRRLLCSLCDTEWNYRRVGCPFCGNEDSAKLGYFSVREGAYRLYVCEECKGYLKTVDRRETWLKHPLPVERILTVGMDVTAAQQGYRPAGGDRAT